MLRGLPQWSHSRLDLCVSLGTISARLPPGSTPVDYALPELELQQLQQSMVRPATCVLCVRDSCLCVYVYTYMAFDRCGSLATQRTQPHGRSHWQEYVRTELPARGGYS